jgi:hypothetical protein
MKDKASDKSPATNELDDKALDSVVGGMVVGPSPTPGITSTGPEGPGTTAEPPGGGGTIKDGPSHGPSIIDFPGPR